MSSETASQNDIENLADCPGIILQENSESNIESACKRQRRPKRILHFSDGDMVEYSSEDEADSPKCAAQIATVNPKSLNWMPWAWYQTVWVSSKVLNGCDYVGEALADFLGITSPKYQFEIDEYKRMQAMQSEDAHRQDLEMGGWNERHRNNIITNGEAPNSEHQQANHLSNVGDTTLLYDTLTNLL